MAKTNNSHFISIRPNPTSDVITIDYNFLEKDKAWFALYDLNGQKARDISLDAETHSVQVDVKDLPKSIYLYKVFTLSGKLQTGKIIIQ